MKPPRASTVVSFGPYFHTVRDWLIPDDLIKAVHVEEGAELLCEEDGVTRRTVVTVLLKEPIGEHPNKETFDRLVLVGLDAEEFLTALNGTTFVPTEDAEPKKESA